MKYKNSDVKRRILQDNPDVRGFNKERKQKLLEELFSDEFRRYISVVNK